MASSRSTMASAFTATRAWKATRPSVAPRTSRVAVNALAMVERELVIGAAHRDAHRDRLADLGCADDRELAERIRQGSFDDQAEAVRAVVAASVRAKLEVANPRWLESD